jgi:hypothetical protein
LNESFAVAELIVSITKATPVEAHVNTNGVGAPNFYLELADEVLTFES